MNGNVWILLGAVFIAGSLCMVYSWKVEADRAAELERQVELLEQRINADAAVMAEREKAREEAARKAQEQKDEIQKSFEGLSDDELLCRLHGLCAKGAGSGSADGTAGVTAGGMPETSHPGGND